MNLCLQRRLKTASDGGAVQYHGFTLVELLVAIAIVAILASLLLGSFSQAKAKALSTACKNNLRQMGIALNMYAHESGYYPPRAHWDKSVNQFITYAWPAHLLPLAANNAAVFRCPARSADYSWPTNRSPLGYDFPLNIDPGTTRFSYGYNGFGAASVGGFGLSLAMEALISANQVKVPADMIAIADSNGDGVRDGEIAFMRPSAVSPVPFPPGDVHSKGANVAFCDGHVEWQKQGKWIELTESAARRWNNDNLPHRELWFGGKAP